uniref:Uncharacterized protein n=1 Tax=Ixodes ricinus TaxID=34613 RepID=A0A090XEY6_IXORI
MVAGVERTVAVVGTVVAKRSPSFAFPSSGTTTALSCAMWNRNRVGDAVRLSRCPGVGRPGSGRVLWEVREISMAGSFRSVRGWGGRCYDVLAC